jgi:hypothetical protein
MHGECSQQNAIASWEVLPLPLDSERAEHGDTHVLTLDPVVPAVKVGDTALIPVMAGAIPIGATQLAAWDADSAGEGDEVRP